MENYIDKAIQNLSKGEVMIVYNLGAKNEQIRVIKPSHAPSSTSTNILSPIGVANMTVEELANEWVEFCRIAI